MSGYIESEGGSDDALPAIFSTLVERVLPGGSLVGHWRLRGGVSANVYCLEAALGNRRERFVVRRHCEHDWKPAADDVTEVEFGVLRVLHGAGLPVPKPLHFDASSELLPSPFFVMPMVVGATSLSDESLSTALPQMAEFLSRLHGLPVGKLELPRLPSRESPVFGALEYLPESEEWEAVRSVVSSVVVEPVSPCLLHGDFWPGNLIWAEGRLAAVVDWEDTALGPPASDVACCRAELNVMFGEAVSEAFLEYYRDRSRQELPDLALWDLYVSSAALATMHEWGLAAEAEAKRRERTLAFAARAADTLLRIGPS